MCEKCKNISATEEGLKECEECNPHNYEFDEENEKYYSQ